MINYSKTYKIISIISLQTGEKEDQPVLVELQVIQGIQIRSGNHQLSSLH